MTEDNATDPAACPVDHSGRGAQEIPPRTDPAGRPGRPPGRMRAVKLALATVATLALLVAGCGSDDEGADPSTTAATTPPTTEPPQRALLSDEATVIAHRGASALAPEHTFAAYDLALSQGADFIEQDIQMTSDGELVVLHDPTLDRTARGPAGSCTGAVATKTLDQLRECEVGSWFNDAFPALADPDFVGQAIPTLAEVFERYGDRVRYYIETKAPEAQPGTETALLGLLTKAGLTENPSSGRVVIQSFSEASLRVVHDLRPTLPLVLLVGDDGTEIDEARLTAIADYAIGVGPSLSRVDQGLVDSAHERCLVVHPWTVDDPAEIGRLLDLGVDGVFTNAPADMVAVRGDHPAPGRDCNAGRG